MRRETMLLGAWCAAVVVLSLIVIGCDPQSMPPSMGDLINPVDVMDMASDRDFAHVTRDLAPTDIFIGRECYQALGDGSQDALSPGEPCALNGRDHCAVPISCTFEAFDFDAACLPGGPVDGGNDYRCCQFVKTHDMVDGSVEQCRNCGAGWVCSPN